VEQILFYTRGVESVSDPLLRVRGSPKLVSELVEVIGSLLFLSYRDGRWIPFEKPLYVP